jgi:O-antigen/teichoic acid export membrane protein
VLRIIVTVGAIQVIAILANLARSKIVAVLLGPEGVGTISVIDQVVQFAAYLSAFSLPLASVKFLSRAHSKGDDAFRRTYSAFLMLLLALAVAGAAVTMALILLRPDWLGLTLARFRVSLLVAAASIPAMSLMAFFTNVLAASQKTRSAAVVAVTSNTALMVGAVAGLKLGYITGLYFGVLIMNIVLVAGMALYLRLSLGLPLRVRLAGFTSEMRANRDVFAFSVCLYLAAAAYSLSLLVARVAILNTYGESAAGLLQALVAIAASIGLVLNPANGLFLTPLMNRDIPAAEKMRASTEFQKRLVVILGLVAMPLVLFPGFLLHVLFSKLFISAGPYMYLFVVAQCILQITGVYQAVMVGLDDLKYYAGFTCAGFLSLALLARLLAPHYGIAGVGLAFVGGTSMILLLAQFRLRTKFGYSIPASLLAVMAYTVSAMLLGGLVLSGHSGPELAVTLWKASFYVCFVVSLLFFLSEEERNSVHGLWTKLRLKAL